MLKNKKADQILFEEGIPLILTIVFFAALLIFVWRGSSGALDLEEIYAKRIALILDNSEKGMKISMDISEVQDLAEKNKISAGNLFVIKNENNLVTVTASKGNGYSCHYFSKLESIKFYRGTNLIPVDIWFPD